MMARFLPDVAWRFLSELGGDSEPQRWDCLRARALGWLSQVVANDRVHGDDQAIAQLVLCWQLPHVPRVAVAA